ncbi:hypothetical protein C9I56_39075 [Paraburkholderia caribensis]|uniref:hypothetical protein n=1 Tax=Paraburkholderia caribensis TaxID=75105 RepID=UPI000D1656DD|nr:hypothetical protein [Paraburkholderia caribensis]PTB23493.1 hypothetical protein C9I56_39075 [Paraburkholderia caribensis]
MGPKLNRRQLERQIGVRGTRATVKIRELISDGRLFYQLEPLGPRDPRRARAYVMVGGASRLDFEAREH